MIRRLLSLQRRHIGTLALLVELQGSIKISVSLSKFSYVCLLHTCVYSFSIKNDKDVSLRLLNTKLLRRFSYSAKRNKA